MEKLIYREKKKKKKKKKVLAKIFSSSVLDKEFLSLLTVPLGYMPAIRNWHLD